MIISKVKRIWEDIDYPFLYDSFNKDIYVKQITEIIIYGIKNIKEGDVVGVIGDFNAESIATLLRLFEKKAIVVPLTKETYSQHSYFIKEAKCQYVFNQNKLTKTISSKQYKDSFLDNLRLSGNAGLILFTTGTTGRPKAILHNLETFLKRYDTPKPPLKALSFLLFDHIGGINTILHMLFNRGQVVCLRERSVENVIKIIKKYKIELLPTTPTFLRMLALSPDLKNKIGDSLKIISYGTERMDQPTLNILIKKFPKVDFRQTYGMSELGILRVKSENKESLFMKIGGEGIETKIINKILYIKAQNRMLGYLNYESPFDQDGWYCTKDIVEVKNNGFIKIIGRDSDLINIGGLKFMPSEVERHCLNFPKIKYAKAIGRKNPITGEHLELYLEAYDKDLDLKEIMIFLKNNLPSHMIPLKIVQKKLEISHRFKKL